MHRLGLFLVISVLYASTTSCGSNKQNTTPFIRGINSESPGIFFPLENNCLGGSTDYTTIASLFSFDLNTFKWSEPSLPKDSKYYDLTRSPWIKEARYRPAYQRVCKNGDPYAVNRSARCLDQQSRPQNTFQVLSNGKKFQLCGSPLNPPRNSADSAFLNATYYISKAASKFYKITHEKLPKISLNIFSEYRSLYSGQSVSHLQNEEDLPVAFYEIVNLVYNPRDKAIGVFPTTDNSAYLFSKDSEMYLWESAFALVHEYGHHIEQTLFTGLGACGRSNYWNPVRHEWSGAEAGNISKRVCSALSEGLADLFSYYLIGDIREELSKITGIGNSRDIADEKIRLNNGRRTLEKVLSLTNFRLFSQDSTDSLTDPHVYGGIISHYLDGVFETVDKFYIGRGEEPPFENYNSRVVGLVDWMHLYTQRAKSSSFSSKDFISHLNQSVEKSFARDHDKYASFDELRCKLNKYSKSHAPDYRHIFTKNCE